MNGIVRKLTEKMTMTRVIVHVTEAGLVHESSMAGLKGKSALDAVTILTTDVLRGWYQMLPTYCVLLDVKKCYPSVQHDILIRRLRDYFCIDGALLGLIADLLRNSLALIGAHAAVP